MATGINKSEVKLKFGWDVSDLTEYVNEESRDLIRQEVLVGDTLDIISIQEVIKHKEKIKIFDTDVTWASGDSCGFDASGDVAFTDREIAVSNIKLEKEFCNLDLLDTWTQQALRAGSMAELEEFPFQDAIVTFLLAKNSLELNKAIWRGDTTGSGNTSFFDGFEKLFTAESAGMIDLNTGGATTFTSSNAFDVLWAAYEDMSADETGAAVLEAGAVAMLTRNQYNALIKNIVDLNQYNFDPTAAAAGKTFVLPGTDLVVRRLAGRSDETKFFIARPTELVFGTDLISDAGNLKIWYNEDEETIRFRLRFKGGCQFPFVESIGYFELAAS